MKLLTAFLFFILCAIHANSQKIIAQYKPLNDSLRIGVGMKDFLPYNEQGFTLVLPDSTKNINGVLISFEDRKFDLQKDPAQQIYKEAVNKNFAVLYISTGIPLDLFFSTTSLAYVDAVMKDVFAKYQLPNKNIFFLGVNLSGHRALKYITYSKQGKTRFNPAVKGVVLCEGVLDWVRQWYEGKKAIRDSVAESSVFEARLVTYLLEKHLGATPKTGLENYLQFSPYSYFDEQNRHQKYYQDLAIRAYTEPATYYWMETKGKTVFDTNFPDMVGIINEQKLAGNTKSELVVFNQDKSNKDRRNPNYTWSLVNKVELMNWITAQIK